MANTTLTLRAATAGLAAALSLAAVTNTSAEPRWGTAAAIGAGVAGAAVAAAAASSYYNSGYYGSGYYGSGYYDYAPGYAPGLAPGGAIGSSGPIYDALGAQFPWGRDDCRLSVYNC